MTASPMAITHGTKEGSFPFMIFGSFIAHGLAILLMLVAPQLFPGTKREPFGGPTGAGGLNVMTVDFRLGEQGKPAPKPITKEAEPAPARVISKLKEEEVELKSKTTIPDPDPKKKKEEPSAKATLNQPERKKEGPFGPGKNTDKETGKSGTQGSGKFGIGTFGSGQPGPGGFGTGTGVAFPFPWYIESVLTKIEINWAKPYIVDTTPRNYVSVVYFVITRSGQVQRVEVEQSSGIAALDRSAESAVLGATPFPPLPSQWTEPELAFRISFTYSR